MRGAQSKTSQWTVARSLLSLCLRKKCTCQTYFFLNRPPLNARPYGLLPDLFSACAYVRNARARPFFFNRAPLNGRPCNGLLPDLFSVCAYVRNAGARLIFFLIERYSTQCNLVMDCCQISSRARHVYDSSSLL